MRKLLCVLPLLAAWALPSVAAAQTNVRVQGTTDTTDSGLVADVIQPGFEAAYPQYRLQYIAVGTGQALTNARAGQGDAVLTHAPTSEATFVGDGYSYEPFGRAIMFNDYVIIGHDSDPAGVQAAANHDAITALEQIADAGDAGNAFFVSRGDNSGTHVQEGLMWAMSDVPTHPLTAGREEPDGNGDGTGTDIPAWYKKAGVGQAATVQVMSQCNFGDPRDRCYGMTDRGTYDRQLTIGAVSGMKIVTEKNAANARGDEQLLTNSFHTYAVNPDKIPSVNLAGALAFLDYLTSPEFQNALLSYPSTSNPRFFPDAFPQLALTSAALPGSINAGDAISVAGTLINRYPGAGAVPGSPASLQSSLGVPGSPFAPQSGTLAELANTTSDGNGAVSFTVRPTRSGAVRVALPRNRDLSPTSFPLGTVNVASTVDAQSATTSYRRVRLRGRLQPATGRGAATLTVLGARIRNGSETRFTRQSLPTSGSEFDVTTRLAPGRWRLRLQYQDPGVVDVGNSRVLEVVVPGRVSVTRPRLSKLARHRVRVTGSFSPSALGRRARIDVLARRGSKGGFKRIASAHPRKGQRRYSFNVTLRPSRWQIKVRYQQTGVVDATSSSTRSVSVR
jgi:tungstate transport system substrate-binding protein